MHITRRTSPRLLARRRRLPHVARRLQLPPVDCVVSPVAVARGAAVGLEPARDQRQRRVPPRVSVRSVPVPRRRVRSLHVAPPRVTSHRANGHTVRVRASPVGVRRQMNMNMNGGSGRFCVSVPPRTRHEGVEKFAEVERGICCTILSEYKL